MMVKDLINELQRMAAQDLKGGDAEVILYDTNSDIEYHADPDSEDWDFEVLRGDGEIVIEFKGMGGAPMGRRA